MILRFLRLENIRSYNEQTVNFPMGTTLFEGDIGSGKSTILMAIEFALFGLGSEKGGALLKAGAKKGLVTLGFEVDGKEYEVCRSLQRKAKGVQQADCTFKTEGTIMQLSASEMKQKVLDVLAFNEPADPKAGSVIFRYAIFTPQEEMKAIIWMRADQRLQTLRKAFRIEDYRIALDNCSALTRCIREKSIQLASYASDLESYREKYEKAESEIERCEKELVSLNDKKTYFDKKATELRKTVETMQKTKDSIGKAVGEVPLLTKEIKDKSGEIVSVENEIQEIALEIVNLNAEVEKLGSMQQPTTKTEYELKDELRLLRAKQQNIISAQGAISSKIVDYESVEQNKVCPTCDRLADPQEFGEKIKLKKEEKSRAVDEVSACERRITETENLRESLLTYQRTQDNLRNLMRQIDKNNGRTKQNREKVQKLTEQVEDAREKLEKAEKGVEEFNRISAETDALSKQLSTAERELKDAEINIFGNQKSRETHVNQAKELEVEIQKKENYRKAADRMKEYKMWLEEYLMPTLEMIEKQVMININQEFNLHFQKWWSMLVEDPSKESRIDEDFTPLVEQDGYEQDYNFLSGGEKTSLALAYRLSLNTIVQKVSAGIKSNLLILDEPTDGFSKEQLYKIREILDELKCPQVVMVSHEKELESFADQVMRIEKKNGVSQIKSI